MTNNSSKVGGPKNEKFENETQKNMAADIDFYFKNELIYLRNKRMATRVKNLLKENPDKSFFFAFGAGLYSSSYLTPKYSNNCLICVGIVMAIGIVSGMA